MKKNAVVAAIAAAMSFTACHDSRPPPPVTPTRAVVASVIPDRAVIDSGVPLVKPEPVAVVVDELALPHEQPTVDFSARAAKLAAEHDAKGALAEARRALFGNPTDLEVLEQIAALSRKAGQPQLAATALGRIASLRPDDALPSIKQARALLKAKDFAGAIAAGHEAARRDPGNPEAFQVTGLAQLSSGDLSGAIVSFKTVVGLQPDHGYAMNNLGLAYLRANQNDAAVEILEDAVEQLPHVAYVHNNLGVAFERVGRADDAKHAYQTAMDLSPKYVKARLNAARVAQRPIEVDGEEETASDMPHPLPPPTVAE